MLTLWRCCVSIILHLYGLAEYLIRSRLPIHFLVEVPSSTLVEVFQLSIVVIAQLIGHMAQYAVDCLRLGESIFTLQQIFRIDASL